MNLTESEIISKLKSFGTVNEDNIEEFEELVYEASEGYKKEMLAPLLKSLDDNCEYEEVMFGLVHTLEQFSFDDYFMELGGLLPELFAKNPKWIMRLHTRIINAPSVFNDYLAKYRSLGKEQRAVLVELLTEVSKKERFKEQCISGTAFIKGLQESQ